MKHLWKDEWFVSTTSTILIHLSLLTFFLLFKVDFRPMIAEFVEVSFGAGLAAPALQDITQSDQDIENTEELKPIEDQPAEALQNIELPERRQLDLNEQEIIEKVQPEIGKKVEGPPAIKQAPIASLPDAKSNQSINPFLSKKEKKVETGIFKKNVDEKLLTGTQKVAINPDKEFEIDWMGDIKREIYQRRLPEFPAEVQREAVIKIRFTVLPNGLVGSAVLLQKGDTRLENSTLEAFKTWRFNPLPNYVEQESQAGIIIFRFKLK